MGSSPDFSLGQESAVGSIDRLVLYNADSDQVIKDPLIAGDIISTTDFGTSNFSVVAEVSGAVDKVQFFLGGFLFHTESIAPYAIEGDNGQGNFYAWSPAPGSYTLGATPLLNNDSGAMHEITFEITDGSGGNTPPIAIITTDVTSGLAPLTVNFDGSASISGDVDDTIISYDWVFGDGSSSSTSSPTHTYVSAGTFTVTLTVEDEAGATNTSSVVIEAQTTGGGGGTGAFLESGGIVSIEAESFFTNIPVGIDEWQEKTTASSSNSAPAGYSGSAALYAADDASNSNLVPGIGPELTYEVNFSTTGKYYLWVRAYADDYNSDRLHGGLDGQNYLGNELRTAYMISNVHDTWNWTNDRGSGSSAAFLTINTPGIYTINIWMQKDGIFFDKLALLAENVSPEILEGTGPAESPRDECETDCNTAPTASFTATPGEVEFEIDFDASTSTDDGSISDWDWDFGDGSSGTGELTNHIYSNAGDYQAILTVTDDEGATGSIQKTVSVTGDGGGTGSGAYLEQSGLVVMEAENAQAILTGTGDNVSSTSDDLVWTVKTDKSGYGGTAALQALTIDGDETGTRYHSGYETKSPEMRFDVQFSQANQFYVWVRMWAISDDDNSVHAGYNEVGISTAQAIEQQGTYSTWVWTKNIKYGDVAYIDVASGLHTVSIWMREDGVYIDKVILTTDVGFVPNGTSDPESPRDDGSGGENQSPTASFTVTTNDLQADFVSTSTDPEGPIDSWTWDFGDGNTSSAETESHTYATSGTYTVSLTVQDQEGASDTHTESVTVDDGNTNSPPTIIWSADPGTTVSAGTSILFDAGNSIDPDGDAPLTYEWYQVEGSSETLLDNGETYTHVASTDETLRLKVGDGSLTSVEDIPITVQAISNTFFYIKDHLGSIRATVDDLGNVVSYSDYYPFGLEMPGRSTIHGSDRTRENFTGHELDTETGLVYAGARYLMPDLGRWMSVDPLSDSYLSLSSYNYALNNPNSFIDPTGLCPEGTAHGEAFVNEAGETVLCYNEGNADGLVVEGQRSRGSSASPVGGFWSMLGSRFFIDPSNLQNGGKGHSRPKTYYEYADGQYWRIVDSTQWIAPTADIIGPFAIGGTGLKLASSGLKALFSNGSIRGQSIIGIRTILLQHGFKMQKARGLGYLFRNGKEEVRLMFRKGKWDIRIRNKSGNWLDEFGDVNIPEKTHGIIIENL